MAKAMGVSKATVQRVWHDNGLKPQLVKTFKVSDDPRSVEKLVDIVGLYLNPLEHALVLSLISLRHYTSYRTSGCQGNLPKLSSVPGGSGILAPCA